MKPTIPNIAVEPPYSKIKTFKPTVKNWIISNYNPMYQLNESTVGSIKRWCSSITLTRASSNSRTSPISPCTTRSGSVRMSLATLSTLLRNVALNKSAEKVQRKNCNVHSAAVNKCSTKQYLMRASVCMHVYVFVCMYQCIYECACTVYTCIHACMYVIRPEWLLKASWYKQLEKHFLRTLSVWSNMVGDRTYLRL